MIKDTAGPGRIPEPREEKAAREAVGASPEARLRWLLRFATLDLRKQEQQSIGLQLAAFIAPHRPLTAQDAATIEGWHSIARDVLKTVGSGWPWVHSTGCWEATITVESDGTLSVKEVVSTKGADESRAQLLADLVKAAGARLRRCPRPDCGTLFVRNGRQGYCTARCATLFRTWKRRGTLERRERQAQENRFRFYSATGASWNEGARHWNEDAYQRYLKRQQEDLRRGSWKGR
jgi:hypothetical protein